MGPTSSGSAVWEARVREAAKQISAAANKPEPSIRSCFYFNFWKLLE